MISLATGAEAQLRRWSNEVAAGSMSFAEYRERRAGLIRQVVGSEEVSADEALLSNTAERGEVPEEVGKGRVRESLLHGKVLFSLTLIAAVVGLLVLAYVLKW
ncbi:MAG: hypothetical protein KDH88_07710 [Chromatiales bacterium]|nr:hypothetical protein [Chromatiales bacterium]